MRRAIALFLLLAALSVAQGDEREERVFASHVKRGQAYRFKLAAGNTSVWEIISKTEDEVRYRIRLTVAGKELASDEVHVFSLERRTDAKPASGETETLRISGIDFPCTILEAESGGTTVRTWRSSKFPEILKVQLGKDVTSELVEIVPPSR